MYILGISRGHDASAALISDKTIIACAQEERFTRIKHFCGFPVESVKFVLNYAGLQPSDIKYVAYPEGNNTVLAEREYVDKDGKPKKQYTRLPNLTKDNITSFEIIDNLQKLGIKHLKKLYKIDHHEAHAASAYRCSGWQKATVITLDGNGDNLSGSIYYGNSGKLDKIAESTMQGSLGWFYSAVTEALGFRPNDEEGKTMSLSAYGRRNPKLIKELRKYAPKLKELVLQGDDPWKILAGKAENIYICHFEGEKEIRKLVKLYGRENVAYCAQAILEETTKKLVRNAVRKTGCGNLAAAGGVFLNVKLNMALEELGCVNEIRPHPASGDNGLALGAALEAAHLLTKRKILFNLDNVYLGPDFNDRDIKKAVKNKGFKINCVSSKEIPSMVSNYLQKGLAVGWFQGRMEYGFRALGSRSVLLDPRNVKAMKRLNIKLKKREWFMPFAPAILTERIGDYIHKNKSGRSPFMLKAFKVKKSRAKDLIACTHVDGTIRAQTISRRQNPLYYDVISRFYKDTAVPAVLNTSFNRHGLPIVCTPGDAVEHLKMGCVDVLVINNVIIENNR